MNYDEAIKNLKKLGSEKYKAGMERFQLPTKNAFGVPMPEIRRFAKDIGTDHKLALKLYRSGILEARILASIIADPVKATDAQIDAWTNGFDSWGVCDQVCDNFISHTRYAWKKINQYSRRPQEFVKRAAFSLAAILAVHDKKAEDRKFIKLLDIIKREAKDERNFVKKAVNWALRNIGKRNSALNARAIRCGEEICRMDSRSAKWIAADALREMKKRRF